MGDVFQYEIPVLHPLAVHFPLALLLLGALAVLLWLVKGTAFWQRTALFLYTFGFAGAAFAYFTGEAMEEQAEGVPVVEQLVELHESMALYTFILSGIVCVLLAAWTWPVSPLAKASQAVPVWGKVAIAGMAFAAAALVAWTAHIGGVMVWGVAR